MPASAGAFPFPPLYAIADADACAKAGWTLPAFAEACLDGGCSLIQLRAKHASSRNFLADAEQVVAAAASRHARVIVNDRADIARLSAASGLHVGQDDLAPADARRVVGAQADLGLSTHTEAQLAAALDEPVTYVAIGPVFGTNTKQTGYDAVGLRMVERAAAIVAGRMPIVAIGGITLESAASVLAAGATSVAVISDLLVGGDPAARVRAFRERLSRV